MKTLKTTFFLLLITCISINTHAKKTISETPEHSHPEYEKNIQDIRMDVERANKTYDQAQEMYKNSVKNMEDYKNSHNQFIEFLKFMLTIIALIISLGLFTYFKKIIKYYKKQYESVFERIKKQQDDIVIRLVDTEKWGEDIRKKTRLVVFSFDDINSESYFSKVVKFFVDSKFYKISSLDVPTIVERISKLEMNELGVVIIDDSAGTLKPDPRDSKKNDINKNMIELVNAVCPNNGFFYYGAGIFPIESIQDQNKKSLVSYANAPAQLYGNLMNLQKFRSIIK